MNAVEETMPPGMRWPRITNFRGHRAFQPHRAWTIHERMFVFCVPLFVLSPEAGDKGE